MCGIFCVLNSSCNNCENLVSQLRFEPNIKRRGPDSFNFQVLSTDEFSLDFAVSVLWLQGSKPTAQPIQDENSVFCYNGDVFSGFNDESQKTKGDTKLFHQFVKDHLSSNTLVSSLSQLHGPYAFVFFDKITKRLYFGRDVFGRRSLLLGQDDEGDTLVMTSVAKIHSEFKFIEVPSVGIFCYDTVKQKFEVEFWPHKNKNFYGHLKALEVFLNTEIAPQKPIIESPLVSHGFVDNDNLALLNNINSDNQTSSNTFELLLNCNSWKSNVDKLKTLISTSISLRISSQPNYCKHCLKERKDCTHATTGILFSGGVDCAVLAAICHQHVDPSRPIDLINVSFDEANNYQSPDRVTGLQTLEELQTLYPNRQWNFVEVNVPNEELDKQRREHIADLIYPLNTILDDSLGCALWFASRAETANYVSPVRILIVGMGADELFGGYSRHRTAFKRYSWKGLQEVLDDDWMNLPYRNLGRDDRVVSDHGRQLRTPYLDEDVVEFLKNLECWEKTYPSDKLPQGVGEKVLLRSLAYDLGLKKAATLKKRALQFGSRIANPKENAHEVSTRLGF